ncbi:MAG: SynChlorMet cassette radical SAM/SPASM protein ScmE [Deltaproteobacteria bacterium]|nr:SynChlorMet cassette radical SAM/SPASM protein ScmE [Deltaproteobacteria bacterium]
MKILRSPLSANLTITNRCNLRCTYCSHFTSSGDVGKDLPGEEWLRFFEELNRCAVMKVTLSGGEPFYREDLKEIVEGIIRNRMRFNILSNGTLITDEMAAFMASTGRCNGVQISIDGSVPVTHEAFRGKGTFYRAVRGIRFLQKRDVPVQVRVTIHRKNIDDLDGIAELLLEEIGLPGFSTNAASYMGLCRQNSEMVQLTPEERSVAMEKLLRLNSRYKDRIRATAGPLADARNWLMMEEARRQEKAGRFGAGRLSGCNGPMTSIDVRADGIMVPCIQMSHIELGRINKDDLKKVWQHHPELKRLRSRINIPLSNFEFCEGCDYIDYCTGNCPALAYETVGQENHPSPDSCLRHFLDQGGRLPDADLLRGL